MEVVIKRKILGLLLEVLIVICKYNDKIITRDIFLYLIQNLDY